MKIKYLPLVIIFSFSSYGEPDDTKGSQDLLKEALSEMNKQTPPDKDIEHYVVQKESHTLALGFSKSGDYYISNHKTWEANAITNVCLLAGLKNLDNGSELRRAVRSLNVNEIDFTKVIMPNINVKGSAYSYIVKERRVRKVPNLEGILSNTAVICKAS